MTPATPPTPCDHRASDDDLVRYHDGDMAPSERDAFEVLLETDATARAQLDALVSVDTAVDRALTRPPKQRPPIQPVRMKLASIGFAAVAIAVGAAVWFRGGTSTQPATTRPRSVASSHNEGTALEHGTTADAVEARPALGHGVVLVVAGQRFVSVASDPSMPFLTTDTAAPSPATQLDALLASGDAQGAARLISAADAEDRAGLADAMSRQLRSASTLDAALRELPPAERLELCLLWMPDARFRSSTLEHLSDLAGEPSISEQYETALAELWSDPTLRPWLTSYGLSPLALAR